MPTLTAALPLLILIGTSQACLPGLGLGYNPYPLGTDIGLPGLGVPPLAYPYGRVGPFRSQASHDQIRNPAVLNCHSLDESCRWSNTNEEELDWVSGKSVPDVLKWHTTLNSAVNPDIGAGALISAARRGWEGGQLVSDPLPCVSSGLRLTATAWKSKVGSPEVQPKLQVCSKNTNDPARYPLINCVELDVRNGVPMTVDVPIPNDPNAPGHIVLLGNNFAAREGGALYVQDIRVDGNLDCMNSAAARPDGQHPTLVDPLQMPHFGNSIADERPVAAPQPSISSKYSTLDRNAIETMDAPPAAPSNPFKSLGQEYSETATSGSALVPGHATETSQALMDTCLAISCDATDYLNCNFWRSSGGNQWEIASVKRTATPKIYITSSPGGAERFLVAPFNDPKENQFTLVSESVSVPATEPVYFCFYEYLSAKGFSLTICTDGNECFYKRSALEVEDQGEWKVRCTKLPSGTYELRVHAENRGQERGELGFLPVRLARDSLAQQLIC